MTATTIPTRTTTPTATASSVATDATGSHPVLRATAVSAIAATAATTVVAVVARAADVPFRIDGEPIPVSGFAMLTAIGVVLGGVLLGLCNRFSAVPRRRFLQVATVLTVVSCVPSLTSPPDTASRLGLVAAHVIAALIAVPLLARRARS